MSNTVTTAELADLIRPFVGKRLSGDLSAALEIDAPGQCYGSADVRSLDDGHVGVFFYRAVDFIPLAKIRRIVVRTMDGEGNYTSATTYEHRPIARAA